MELQWAVDHPFGRKRSDFIICKLLSINLDSKYDSQGARIDIISLEEENAGIYSCVARNELGSAEASIPVEILGIVSLPCIF